MAANDEVVDTTQPLLNINMVNVTKLNSFNYMTWRIQVHALLDGYDLAGHLDGSTPMPDQTTQLPAYTKWRRQDKLINSGLIGTLSPSIQSLVTKTKTAQDL